MALRHSEKGFRELADNAPLIIWMTDGQGNNEFVNKAYQSFFGVAPEEVAERRWMELVHPDDHETYVQKFLEIYAARLPFRAEARVRRADGEWRWLESYAIPRSTESGATSGMIGCSADITERKQAEDTMGQLVAIVESSDDAIVSKDLNGVIMSWNKGAEKLFGYSAEEVIGKSIMIVIPPDREDEEKRVLESIRRGEKIDHYETVRRRKDGAPVEISLTVSPLRDKAGAVIGGAKIARDITERKRAEKLLRQNAAQLALITNTAPVFIAHCDAQARFKFVNKAYAERFGLRPEDCIGKRIPEVVGEEAYRSFGQHVEAALRGEPVKFEIEIPYEVIGKRFMHCSYAPEFDANGKVVGFVAAITDISARKQAEEKLIATTAKFESVFNQSGIFAAITDLQGNLREVNDLAVNWCGYTREQVLDRPFWETPWWRGSEDVKARVRAATEQAAAGMVFREELPYWWADGTERVAELAIHPIRDQDGRVMLLHPTGFDLTERKRAEEKIARLLAEEQAAREVAEQATRAKDEFLAIVSHELRSPLNAILGWNSMLRSHRGDDPYTARVIETIERNGKAQLRLIEDLLDTARIITGKMKLEVQPVEPVVVIAAALDTVRTAANSKGIIIATDFDPKAGQLTCDPARLQQVVWNLVSNAIKFTPEGGRVWVELRRDGSGVRIVVRDTGQGIEPDLLPYVFDRFKQGDSSTSRRFGGLGLGLSLVKHLVELHGGAVTAESPGKGKGTTVTVSLPVRAVRAPGQAGSRGDWGASADRPAIRPSPSKILMGVRARGVDGEA